MMYYRIIWSSYTEAMIIQFKIPVLHIYGCIQDISSRSYLCIHEDNAAFAALCGVDITPITFIKIHRIVDDPLGIFFL